MQDSQHKLENRQHKMFKATLLQANNYQYSQHTPGYQLYRLLPHQ
jgi:hypothetical protein